MGSRLNELGTQVHCPKPAGQPSQRSPVESPGGHVESPRGHVEPTNQHNMQLQEQLPARYKIINIIGTLGEADRCCLCW